MGSCTWFGAVSGDWGYRERRIGERVCVCYCAVWRRTGRRKESYNVGVPTKVNQLILNYNKTHYLQFNMKNSWEHDLKLNYQGN